MKLPKYLLLTVAAWILATAPCRAAYDIFLQTDTPVIAGDSTASGFAGAWELLSFSHGVTLPITGVGANRSVGISEFSDVAVAKFLDKSSVLVLLKVAEGSPIGKVTVTFRKAGPTGANYTFYQVVLENVLVSSMQQGGSAGSDDRLTESIAFNFNKITWTYYPVSQDGKVGTPITKSWDRTTKSGP
jgi:type VI secretion system secreted protein Hcp